MSHYLGKKMRPVNIWGKGFHMDSDLTNSIWPVSVLDVYDDTYEDPPVAIYVCRYNDGKIDLIDEKRLEKMKEDDPDE